MVTDRHDAVAVAWTRCGLCPVGPLALVCCRAGLLGFAFLTHSPCPLAAFLAAPAARALRRGLLLVPTCTICGVVFAVSPSPRSPLPLRLGCVQVLTVIGEGFPAELSEDIAGLVLSTRRQADRISMWTKTSADEPMQKRIGYVAAPGGTGCGHFFFGGGGGWPGRGRASTARLGGVGGVVHAAAAAGLCACLLVCCWCGVSLVLVCPAGVLTSGVALLRGSWWRCAVLDFPCLSLLRGWMPAPPFPLLSPLFLPPSLAITFARPAAVRRGARRPHQPAFTTMCSLNTSSTRTRSPRTAATRTRPGLLSRGGGLWGSLPSKRWGWECGWGLHGRSDMGGVRLGPFFLHFFSFFFLIRGRLAHVFSATATATAPWHPSPWLARCMPRRPPPAGVRVPTRVAPRTGPVAWPLSRMFRPGRSRTVEQGPLPLVDLTMTAVWHTLCPSRGHPAGRRQRHRATHG